MNRALLVSAVLLCNSGCFFRILQERREAAMPLLGEAAAKAPRATTFTQYGRDTEAPPSDLSPEVLADDATIVLSPEQVCFDVTVRAPSGVDLALNRYQWRCFQNPTGYVDTALTGTPTERTVEHPFVGEPPRLSIWTRAGGFSAPVGPAQQRVLRVVERSGRLCCPGTRSENVSLVAQAELPGRPAFFRNVELKWDWVLQRRHADMLSGR